MRKDFAILMLCSSLASGVSLSCAAEDAVKTNLGKAIFEHSSHNYAEAEKYYSEALHETNNPEQQVFALKGLAMLSLNQGKNSEAADNFKKAVDLEQSLQTSSLDTKSATLCNLGVAYTNLGRYTEAEPVYKRALALSVESGHKRDQSQVYDHISMLLSKMGRFDEANSASQTAVSLAEGSWGLENPNTASILANRGFLLGLRGRYREGEAYLRKAMAIDEKAMGQDNNVWGGAASDLSKLCIAQGKLKEAQKLLTKSIAIRSKINGEEDLGVANMEAFLSRAYLEDGDLAKAQSIAQKSLDSAEKKLGDKNPGIYYQLIALGDVYERRGDLNKASEFAHRALDLRKDHKALVLMAKITKGKGDLKAAESFAREALKKCEKNFGPEHLEVAKCALVLASILKAEHSAEATAMENKASEIRLRLAKLNAPAKN